MSVKVPSMVMDLDHCQVVPLMSPSRSVREAVTSLPTAGDMGDRVTVPASSMLVTMMATSTISISPPAEAMTVTM